MLVFKTTLTKYCLLVIFVMVPWNTNIATIHSGTFHVNDVIQPKDESIFSIKMYGTQDIHFVVDDGHWAYTEHPGFKILSQQYDQDAGELIVTLAGHDIQGETGKITIRKK